MEVDQPGRVRTGLKACKMLILNYTDKNDKIQISGEAELIRKILPELGKDCAELESQRYVSKLTCTGLCLVEMMERLYEHEFILEACYAANDQADLNKRESNFNEYIFVNKSK